MTPASRVVDVERLERYYDALILRGALEITPGATPLLRDAADRLVAYLRPGADDAAAAILGGAPVVE